MWHTHSSVRGGDAGGTGGGQGAADLKGQFQSADEAWRGGWVVPDNLIKVDRRIRARSRRWQKAQQDQRWRRRPFPDGARSERAELLSGHGSAQGVYRGHLEI